MKMKTPKKKPVKTAKIPPPPPGWEIVGKDDPRLDCLPDAPRYLVDERWVLSRYGAGESLPEPHRKSKTYALPIATQPAQSPTPMIRLRLPSEKPTREDSVYAVCKTPSNKTLVLSWPIILPFNDMVTYRFSLPEGILPREPTQEEKWRKEFEAKALPLIWPNANTTRAGDGYESGRVNDAWAGFLAAKKGGAE